MWLELALKTTDLEDSSHIPHTGARGSPGSVELCPQPHLYCLLHFLEPDNLVPLIAVGSPEGALLLQTSNTADTPKGLNTPLPGAPTVPHHWPHESAPPPAGGLEALLPLPNPAPSQPLHGLLMFSIYSPLSSCALRQSILFFPFLDYKKTDIEKMFNTFPYKKTGVFTLPAQKKPLIHTNTIPAHHHIVSSDL